MTTESNCGTCRHHDRTDCNNRNGRCDNPESPRFNIVTGPQGHCVGWAEPLPLPESEVNLLPQQVEGQVS